MKTILFIEDNDVIRENTAEILELTGYTVLTAENGKIGIEKALETRPDLVICDIMMPVLDGYGVVQIFNKNPNLSGIPFIFLTAKTERNDFRKGMELGADDYLTKPFEESELLSAIEGRLNRFNHLLSATQPFDESAASATQSKEYPVQARQTNDLASLLMDRKVHAVRRKQYLYTEGDEPMRMYFLQAGKVKTVRTNADGKELITGLYDPGDFFGYLALLHKQDYADSAVALEDSVVIYIPKSDFEQLLTGNAEVSRHFIQLLAGRINEREVQLIGMAYNSLRRRVADTLLQLHQQQSDGLIQLSRDDLAALVGTASESLIRILSEFRQDGFIEQVGSPLAGAGAGTGIRVLQPEKLSRATWW